MQYVDFYNWLLSLHMLSISIIMLKHELALHSFLRLMFHCMDSLHFVLHPSVDRHLGCFFLLIIINNAAMNILCKSVCVDMCFQFFWVCL